MRKFQSPDGTIWTVEVTNPGASNAMVVFKHPDRSTARRDRYAWYQARTPEARNVTARLDPKAVLESITERQMALLFRKSMLISAADNPLGIPVTNFAA